MKNKNDSVAIEAIQELIQQVLEVHNASVSLLREYIEGEKDVSQTITGIGHMLGVQATLLEQLSDHIDTEPPGQKQLAGFAP